MTENSISINSDWYNTKDKDVTTLSDADRDILLSLLENPPELDKTLKSGIKQFKTKYRI